MKHRLSGFACASLAVCAIAAHADDKPARPTYDEHGVVHVPAFELPPSAFSSPEAQAFMKLRARMPIDLPTMEPDIAKSRKALEAMLAPQVAQVLKAYPVDVAETEGLRLLHQSSDARACLFKCEPASLRNRFGVGDYFQPGWDFGGRRHSFLVCRERPLE